MLEDCFSDNEKFTDTLKLSKSPQRQLIAAQGTNGG